MIIIFKQRDSITIYGTTAKTTSLDKTFIKNPFVFT